MKFKFGDTVTLPTKPFWQNCKGRIVGYHYAEAAKEPSTTTAPLGAYVMYRPQVLYYTVDLVDVVNGWVARETFLETDLVAA